MREAQLATLQRIADLATAESADFIIIAGDLFESNEVSKSLAEKAARILTDMAPIKVLILPGTHDLLDEGSVYKRKALRSDNIFVFGIDGSTAKINDVAVHGQANTTKQGGVRPLLALGPDGESKINIAVVHASIEIEGKSNPSDYLVSPEEIARSGMDYIALGHWHRMCDFGNGKTKAWYCGAPEATKFDEADKAGYVLLVDLKGDISVSAKRVGYFEWLERSVDIEVSPPGESLNHDIDKLAGKNVLLRLQFKGTLPEGQTLDVDMLESEFGSKFFYFSIDDSKMHFSLAEIENTFAEGTIGSLFVARLEDLISKAKSEEEKKLLKEALRVGGNYLAQKQEVE